MTDLSQRILKEREENASERREREKDKETVCVRYPFEESKHLFSSSHKEEEDKRGAEEEDKGEIRVSLLFILHFIIISSL